jgi:hypothetical protein
VGGCSPPTRGAASISIADRASPASISIADRRGRGSISMADHHDRPTVPRSTTWGPLAARRSPLAARRWSMVDGRWSMVGFSFPKCPVGNNSLRLPDVPAKKVFLCGALDVK